MRRPSTRIIAIDWSGASSGARNKIWLAEARDGGLVRLEDGRTRDEIADHLIEEAGRDPHLIVGLDFAFSLPAWFLEERGLASARDLWALAEREAESWLAGCEPPFWGRSGRGRPELPEHFRRTDRELPAIGGVRPKSALQIGGAGAAGTGSLRGMPLLRRLSVAGFSVWPFDAPRMPLVIEIHPRLLSGAVAKSDPRARAEYLARRHPGLGDENRAKAASSEDAFDAAVSALVMAEHVESLASLPAAEDRWARLEGRIWHPSSAGGPTGGPVHPRAHGNAHPDRTPGPRPHVRPGPGLRPGPDRQPGPDPRAPARLSMRTVPDPDRQPDPDPRPDTVPPPLDPHPGYAALLDALSFAAAKHRDQRRKGGDASPYINHPIRVAQILAGAGGVTDVAVLQAAVLHDTIEDTETTAGELEATFGPEVRRLVEEVTDDKRLPKDERKRLQIERARSLSAGAKQIRIADKIANIADVAYSAPEGWTLERRKAYLDWTAAVVAGCRGCNPALERRYDRVLAECRAVLARQEHDPVSAAGGSGVTRPR